MRALTFALALSTLGLVACESKTPPADAPPPPAAAAEPDEAGATPTAVAAEGHVHDVTCACTQGKACGNLIKVGEEYLPIEGDVGLEPMAFCGKTGLQAEVAGSREGDTFVATSFKLIEAAKKN